MIQILLTIGLLILLFLLTDIVRQYVLCDDGKDFGTYLFSSLITVLLISLLCFLLYVLYSISGYLVTLL